MTDIPSTVTIQKISPANIHIDYKINGILDRTNTHYTAFNLKTIRSAFGLSTLKFDYLQTRVIILGNSGITATDNSISFSGYTGLKVELSGGDDYMGIGRIYLEGGQFGQWSLATIVYDLDTYGQIDIWGATIS